MFKSFLQDGNDLELIDLQQYILFKDEKEIDIRIGKTKTKKYLVIQAQYENNKTIDSFQTKLTVNNLKEKSKHFKVASNIDECFILLTNLFEIKDVWVKDILNKNYLKLVFNFQKKDLEINLPYKKNETKIFFRKGQAKNESINNDINLNLNIDENININEIKKNEEMPKKEEKIEEKAQEHNINESNNKKEEENKDKDNNINDIIKNNIDDEQNKNEIKVENNNNNENGLETDNIKNTNNIIENHIPDNKENIEIKDNSENKENEETRDNIENMENQENKINIDKKEEIIESIEDKENKNNLEKNENGEDKINKDNLKKKENIENLEGKENILNTENIEIKENKNEAENKEENMNNIININNKEINNIIKNNINDEIQNNKEEKDSNFKNINSKDIESDNMNNNNEDSNKNIENKIEIVNKENEKEENNNNKEDKVDKGDKEDEQIKKDNNNIIINELMEKMKKLEEENKKLKEENSELKEKLSQFDFTKEKLKKSEKEKEKLKIELQQLKNKLNEIKPIEENKPSKPNNINVDFSLRQQSLALPTRMDLNQAKNQAKKVQKKIKINPENKNKINIINEKEEDNKNQNIINIKFESKSPINLKIHRTITHSSYLKYSIDNTFTVFTSLKNELLLVYATKIKSIECFDLVKNKFHKAILNAHNGEILTIRHYCPKYLSQDLILSGSNGDYAVKIWDVKTWTCIFNINKIYQKGNMFSICIFFDEYQKESFVFTSSDSDYIKMWEMNGSFVKNINKTNINGNYFIDTYYDKKEYKYYLISGEMKSVKSYDINVGQLFRTYIDNNSFCEHVSAFIFTQGGIEKLVECEFYGTIRIWNFHTGNIIQKIDICRRTPLVSLCLWNENYLLVSCVDNTIKLVDFKNYALIKSFTGHNNEVCTLKKCIHPTFGECLLSQGLANEQIKMWING